VRLPISAPTVPRPLVSFTAFVSDVHLAEERPRIVERFFEFLADDARAADALYVLGDLFEYWAGDDDLDDPLNQRVANAFSTLHAAGTAVHFLHGNRDFLVGKAFAERSSAALIADGSVIDLYDTPTLLMHGDTLCTDDVEYQKFRAYARDPGNQARFLAQPLAARRDQIRGIRAESESAKGAKSAEIMDVNRDAVDEALRRSGYPRLIHGHTHRPGRHVHEIDGHTCERWVLADWYANGSYLKCDASGCTAVTLAPL
jgi:UDP-2,3-diacylglucosamine hydrolase